MFEYRHLTERQVYGIFKFFLDEECLCGEYESVSLMVILNRLGRNGWQMVGNHPEGGFIFMRKMDL